MGLAQEQTAPAKTAKPATEKKSVSTAPVEKIMGGYQVHSMVEVGGRLTERGGSSAMWATMINQTTGGRVIGQSLEMRSVNPIKTPFFDTLSTFSEGYGGDPYDVSNLKLTKGRLYDFTGTFRRDRNYFDYNLLANSLLSTATAATPALVAEPDSLHLFNTVRHDTDTLLTLFPVSVFHVRAGYNHGTHEGPTFSTMHGGGDVQLAQLFRNQLDTYTGGVDVNLAKRTVLSYDQFFALYKGDTSSVLGPTPFRLSNGTPVSLGVDVLTGPATTCGTGANKTENVIGGIANPFCSGTTTENQAAPTRTSFPTEQLRFSSRYWDHVAMNGRFLYSGSTSTVNSYNETFLGLARASSCPTTAACMLRGLTVTGAGPNGRFARNQRVNVNADFGIEAELSSFLSISDAVTFWDFRVPGYSAYTSAVVTGPTATTSMLTPLTSANLTTRNLPSTASGFLGQKNLGNTILGTATVTPEFKISAGWRFNNRQIDFDTDSALIWHQNWMLLGAVVQPSPMVRLTVNYDIMSSKAANSDTPTDTYTREAPNKIQHLRARATVRPAKWINFAVTGNDYIAKNTDPLVEHAEHNHDFSFGTQIIPVESLSFDFSFAHDDVFSTTDLCFLTTASTVPEGAPASAGTCLQTAANPGGTLPTAAATSQLHLGNGYYDAPSTFFSGSLNYFPSKYFRINAGARINSVDGHAEMLNPLMVPGALQSNIFSPFTDLVVNIAPQWSWHGNWNHQAYNESGAAGPAGRNFSGDIITLGVKYAF
jgi:hypothetical protein